MSEQRLFSAVPKTMGPKQRKPNVESLVRDGNVAGLVEAASYREVVGASPATLTDLGVPVRARAILALGDLDADAGQEAAALGLHDPADRVRCAAVSVLAARKETGILLQALRWLPGEGESRKVALRAVGDLRRSVCPADVADALINSDDEEPLNEDEEPLIQALLAEKRSGEADQLIQLLVSSLANERGIVADRAGELLLRLAPASIDAVVAELRYGRAAAEAAYVLGRIADPRTLDALLKALGDDDDAVVRAESAAALAELQDPAAVKALLSATHDADYRVRTQASRALDRLGTAAVIVGVAAQLESMILAEVRAAIGQAQADPDGREQASRRRSRSQRSNGGPPEAAEPRSTGWGPPPAT